MCDTRRYGLLDGNALVGRSRYEQNEVAARTRISLAATKTRLQSKEVTPSCADSTRSAALRCVQAEPCRYLRRGPFYTLMTSVSG